MFRKWSDRIKFLEHTVSAVYGSRLRKFQNNLNTIEMVIKRVIKCPVKCLFIRLRNMQLESPVVIFQRGDKEFVF